MSTGDDVSRDRLLEPAHRIEALFEVAVIALQTIVQVLRGPVLRVWEDGPSGGRIALRFVGGHLHRCYLCLVHGTLEEGFGRSAVPALREVGVHYLTDLIDRAVHVAPRPIQACVR